MPRWCRTAWRSPVTSVFEADEVSLGDAVGPVDGDDPGTLGRIAVLGHLVQVGLGEEARVGHQALVDRAELVDAELGVGDEAAVLAAGLLAEQQVAQDLLEGGVAEADLVDEAWSPPAGTGRRAGRGRSGRAGRLPRRGARLMPLVDQAEQQRQRLVQVGAVPRRGGWQAPPWSARGAGQGRSPARTPRRRRGARFSSGDASAYSRNRIRYR